jgi:hypothetical protein
MNAQLYLSTYVRLNKKAIGTNKKNRTNIVIEFSMERVESLLLSLGRGFKSHRRSIITYERTTALN